MRLPLALACLLAIGPAHAAVRRCVLPDGTTVFTDRRCDTLGAAERKAPPRTGGVQLRTHRASCARSLRDLYFEVSSALESRDANRLAAVYHWPGHSTRDGYGVMQRLQAIVARPLVGLEPVYPGGDTDAYATGRTPIAFRIEQTLANGSTPSRTLLGLRKHLQCWWVTLGATPRAAPPRTPSPLQKPPTAPPAPVADDPPAAADPSPST